jgi:hypothetical protein
LRFSKSLLTFVKLIVRFRQARVSALHGETRHTFFREQLGSLDRKAR